MMFESESQNYYDVLDVKPDASQNEIRQAYFRIKSAYSKDSAALYSLFDENESRLVLERIEQAFLVLSNPEKRKEYDKIHGFLKASDMLTTRKPSAPTHVFSFGQSTSATLHETADQAAQKVLGLGAGDALDDMSGLHNADEAQPIEAITVSGVQTKDGAYGGATPQNRPIAPEEDYSTPRTLASHGAAGPPSQDYPMRSNENRLGIIRRIDLAKPYERNPNLEDEIGAESGFRGGFLRKIREYRNISIEELSEFTKISKTYINCIEAEEFESLPAPVYLRGFILQIAKALKLPHDKAANAYMAHYKSSVLK